MNNLQQVLEKINEGIHREITNFVHYKSKTGEIIKITNTLEQLEGTECIEVNHDTVKDIIIGNRKLSDYVVKYDADTKRPAVVRIDTERKQIGYYYQLPKTWVSEKQYKEQILSKEKQSNNQFPIYEDIHVDVWYRNLEHLAGQHVWYNNAVYRMKDYQSASTPFDMNNVDLIVDNVKLFDDENKELYFDKNITDNSRFMSNNKLFMYKRSIVDDSVDMIVIQNVKKNKWQIFLSDKVYKSLKEYHKSEHNYSMHFGVTSYNDPNILYRTLTITVKDLILSKMIEIPFKYDWENEVEDVSIFVEKYFDSYFYGVVQ